MSAQQFVTKHQYPTRYWLMVVYLVGMPGIVKFDATGSTHEFGLINPQSLGEVALTLFCATALFCLTFTKNSAIHQRRVSFCHPIWLSLIALLVIASILSPDDKILVSLYRMVEWLVFYGLLASLYTREPTENAAELLRNLVMKLVNISILLVLAGLLVYPSLAFASPEEVTGSIQFRLGGFIVGSNILGVLSSTGLIHTVLYRRGERKLLLCLFYGMITVLTVSRGAWVGLILAGFVYIVRTPSRVTKAMGLLSVVIVAVIGPLVSDRFLKLVERGHGTQGLGTLSERTFVWATALKAFHERPWIGYGYVDGVKRVLAKEFPFSWWTPPHCHNELLQALVSGGILCGIIVVFLWIYLGFRVMKLNRRNRRNSDTLFFLLIFVQIAAYALITPVIVQFRTQIGSLFLLCFMACFDALPRQATIRGGAAWQSTQPIRINA
jgi:O-antigen ligase